MKSMIALVAVVLLANCGGHMGMHMRGGGMGMHSGSGMHAPSSSAYGPSHSERDDGFHSWVN